MKYLGWIQADDSAPPITHGAWMDYMATVDDLVRPPRRLGRNPANGEPTVLRSTADTVHLIFDDQNMGTFSWFNEDPPSINVESTETDCAMVVRRAKEIAEVLGAVFTEWHDDTDDQ